MVSKLLFSRNTRTSALYMSKSNCSCPGANFATHSGRLQLMSRDIENRDFYLEKICHGEIIDDRLTVNKPWFYHISSIRKVTKHKLAAFLSSPKSTQGLLWHRYTIISGRSKTIYTVFAQKALSLCECYRYP